MRIGQMVAGYQRQTQVRLQALSQLESGKPFTTSTVPGLKRAQETNQARLSDASKGFVQADQFRAGLATVSSGVDQARSVLARAAASGLNAEDRAQLQRDFTAALAVVKQGAKDQGAALADQSLANKSFAASRLKPVSADQLGQGQGSDFTSVAALATLDLGSATTEQLAGAGKVLASAAGQLQQQVSAATAQSGRIAGQFERYQAVQHALTGTAPTQGNQQQRSLAALKALLQPQSTSAEGTRFSGVG
jgi:hypothetical protein